ncbi:MAG: hypothetical protein AABM66_04800 [Actinomycetota bacterium]
MVRELGESVILFLGGIARHFAWLILSGVLGVLELVERASGSNVGVSPGLLWTVLVGGVVVAAVLAYHDLRMEQVPFAAKAPPRSKRAFALRLRAWRRRCSGCLEEHGFFHPLRTDIPKPSDASQESQALKECWHGAPRDELIELHQYAQDRGWIEKSDWRPHFTGLSTTDEVWAAIDRLDEPIPWLQKRWWQVWR